ncbi:MAG TPA: VWA domain-containing protein [Acidimicrobiales bacterium]|nr:VWA domain-containing protein [Acidimicrobiales bacterium]
MTPDPFPFTAVVGQEDVKLALLLNAVDPRIGGVLLRGQKGSAKSTLARGLAALLPGAAPFVDLPIGATEDRVVGTIDIEAALTEGRRRFQPGLLAAADGGVLYVDEVNLLPDHLVDVLLDVAAGGVNRVEREGVSEAHPARFVLAGSMNPEEGELRPQLLDRFGLAVDVAANADPAERAEAVRRRLAHDADPARFSREWAGAESEIRERLTAAHPAALPGELLETVSRLCAAVGAEGLRADLVICRAAAALAGWDGRSEATPSDVRRVAPLALAHRRRRNPFEEPGVDRDQLDAALDDALEGDGPPPDEGGDGPDAPDRPPARPDAPTPVIGIHTARRPAPDAPSGRRSPTLGRRGRLVGDRVPDGPVSEVALGATTRAAAARRTASSAPPAGPGAVVTAEDLREPVREQLTGNLVVLAVDASGSMGAERRMEAVKGAVLSLLLDAYQRRDRVCLVTFRGEAAEVALRPTGSVEVARHRLAELPTGGRTPLAAGIRTALQVATTASGPHRPLLVLVSDGRATAAPGGADPVAAAVDAAGEVRRRGVPAVVVDVEDGAARLGLAPELARRMGARCVSLPELSAGALGHALRGMVGG